MFTDKGQGEVTKGAVHGALLTIATLCAVYNACASRVRKDEHHLKVNAVVYTALIAFEVWQIREHSRIS